MSGFPADAVMLAGDVRMPLLGFGTYELTGTDGEAAIRSALDAGYRHLDTATIYGNEDVVGRAVAGSGIDRAEVFVTTKCPHTEVGRELATLEQSLRLLGMSHVDLWLIHRPPLRGEDEVPMWRAVAQARDRGLARAIGVSNYSPEQIDRLTAETGVVPALNQIRWTPFLFDAALLAAHRERGVVVEGYTGLRRSRLDDATLMRIAAARGRTVPQIIIRWHLQHGVSVIPRSSRPERIRENADVAGFMLSAPEMAAINALGGIAADPAITTDISKGDPQ